MDQNTKNAAVTLERELAPEAFFKLTYGLFLLTAREGARDNGCIINTVMQVTDEPKQIEVAVNKANLTAEMIERTGRFNVSVLTEDAPFSLYKYFGYTSGRDADKFADFTAVARSENGLLHLTEQTNAFFSAEVVDTRDVGTHLLFTARVTEARVLSEARAVTYAYYFEYIKPKPEMKKKKGYVCTVCGWVYEGEELPPDIICPLCKHGADAFQKIEP